MNRAWLRWVPAAAVPAVIAAGVLAGSIPARAGDPLPEKTPAQVLVLLGEHKTKTFSGTVEQTSELGLPELPATGPSSGPAAAGGVASIAELLTGKHTARVYLDGPAKVRIQLVDRLAERDVIRRDSDIWFYNSRDNSAAHLTLPAFARDLPLPAPPPEPLPVPEPPVAPAQPDQEPATPKPTGPAEASPAPDLPVPMPEYSIPTPVDIATRLLAAVDSSTLVTVGPDVEVAGRAAYNLVLEPRTEGTLVGQVAIAVDGETGLPLRVSVTARDQVEPAFQTGFASLSLATPDDSLFTFAPPPGATVKELQLPLPGARPWPVTSGFPGSPGTVITPDALMDAGRAYPMPDMARPTVTGSGWETVIGFPALSAGQGSMRESLLKDPFLAQAAVVVPGGRLLSTTLVNVLITDDGRIFVGMVPAERLQAAAGTVAK
jgi:outer membrane lipoprotein-sorting protein